MEVVHLVDVDRAVQQTVQKPRLGIRFRREKFRHLSGFDFPLFANDRAKFVITNQGLGELLAARLAKTSHHLARLILSTTIVVELFVAVGGTFAVLLNG